MICRDTHTHGWVYGWFGGWVAHWVNGWDQVKSLKFNKSWPKRDSSILFEDLWFVKAPPPMGWYVVGWVDVWVNGWGQVKSLIIEQILT